GRRRDLHRDEGQAAPRDLRPEAAFAPEVAARLGRDAAAEAAADREGAARDELGGRRQRQDPNVEPVRVRREAHRSDAARDGGAARGEKDRVRRREHARDEFAEGERLPAPGTTAGLDVADLELGIWN